MYLTTIAGGSGDTYQDVQGRTLILTGNDRLWSGRQVWTDGHYIFSFAQQSDTPPNKPVISEDNLIFPYLLGGGQYKFFTKDFLVRELAKGYGDGIFVAGRKNSYLIADSVIYDFGNGGKFSNSYNEYKTRDACVDADGNLIRLIEDDSNTGDYYALVYKNNDLIKKHTFQITQYSWVVWQFAKVRPDCSFYGLFFTHETPYIPWSETPISANGIYRHYKMNYEYCGVSITDEPYYEETYTYSDSSTSAKIYHYESDAQIYKEIAFYYDSKQGRKDVWVQTTTGGNIQSENYGKDKDGTRLKTYTFIPTGYTFSPQAGFGVEVDTSDYPAGVYCEVPTDTEIPICTGNRPSSGRWDNNFRSDLSTLDGYIVNNRTITSLVVYVGEPILHPKTVETVSQPFDFPTSDNNATEPMHCHVNSYFNVDWNCLGLHREHSGDFIRDALKIGGKTYFKMHYSSLYDSSGKIVVEMDSNNFRIKATGMGEILHKNISKIK